MLNYPRNYIHIARSSSGSRLIGDPPKRWGQKIMWYTYNLISLKNGRLYTGITSDIKRRVKEHNSKRGGHYTSRNAPFKLVHYEAFEYREESQRQEKFYKSGYGKEVLKEKISLALAKYENLRKLG